MTYPACHLPATDAGKWDTARVSRMDWAGAARMAKARAAAAVELNDTDLEALRRDTGAHDRGPGTTSTPPNANQKKVHSHGTP